MEPFFYFDEMVAARRRWGNKIDVTTDGTILERFEAKVTFLDLLALVLVANISPRKRELCGWHKLPPLS